MKREEAEKGQGVDLVRDATPGRTDIDLGQGLMREGNSFSL